MDAVMRHWSRTSAGRVTMNEDGLEAIDSSEGRTSCAGTAR